MNFSDPISRLIVERATPPVLLDPRFLIKPDYDSLPPTEGEVLRRILAGRGWSIGERGDGTKFYLTVGPP